MSLAVETVEAEKRWHRRCTDHDEGQAGTGAAYGVALKLTAAAAAAAKRVERTLFLGLEVQVN